MTHTYTACNPRVLRAMAVTCLYYTLCLPRLTTAWLSTDCCKVARWVKQVRRERERETIHTCMLFSVCVSTEYACLFSSTTVANLVSHCACRSVEPAGSWDGAFEYSQLLSACLYPPLTLLAADHIALGGTHCFNVEKMSQPDTSLSFPPSTIPVAREGGETFRHLIHV